MNPVIRPEKSAVCTSSAPEKAPENPIDRFGFSEMLSVLLGMTVSGGIVNRTLFSLFKDIFPYADPHDQRIIGKMMQLSEFRPNPPRRVCPPTRPLTAHERLFGMLHILKKYADKPTADRFTMLERIFRTQQKLENGNLMTLLPELMGADNAQFIRMMQQMQHK